MKLSPKEFDRTVHRAVIGIPKEIRRHLDNVVISVKKRPSREMLAQFDLPPDEDLLGFYWGSSLMERSVFSPLDYPDTIFIFQVPLEEICETMEELEEQIRITVVHEIAHFLGISEDRLYELGYG
jgi:predicted Zn-dependent protease with MMP-like domain